MFFFLLEFIDSSNCQLAMFLCLSKYNDLIRQSFQAGVLFDM